MTPAERQQAQLAATSALTHRVTADVRAIVGREEAPQNLDAALRLLAKWRSHLIQNALLQASGTRVLGGIFAGMDFLPRSAEGCHIAKLLGTYEQPLQPYVAEAIERRYPLVINIGCAEGYYAVGLAMRMAGSRVLAFDLNENARRVCEDLARRNGVADRITIGERFTREDFARFAGSGALVVCDIEGAERELLDPSAAPALADLDIIVEAHDCSIPGLAKTLKSRFSATHDVRMILDTGSRNVEPAPDWFTKLAHLDQLLAVWEWRSGATPWLVMRRRRGGAP